MGEDCDSESVTGNAIFIKESCSSDLNADLGEVGESTLRELVKDLRELRRDGGTRRDGVGGEPNTQKPVIISVLSLYDFIPFTTQYIVSLPSVDYHQHTDGLLVIRSHQTLLRRAWASRSTAAC